MSAAAAARRAVETKTRPDGDYTLSVSCEGTRAEWWAIAAPDGSVKSIGKKPYVMRQWRKI